jgi:hypothetical protein
VEERQHAVEEVHDSSGLADVAVHGGEDAECKYVGAKEHDRGGVEESRRMIGQCDEGNGAS